DLLLGGGRSDDARRPRILRVPAQRLEHDEGADAIVDGTGDQPIVRKVHRLRIDHAGIADGQARFSLGARGGADVDPEIGDLGRLFAIRRLHEMDRLLPDDTDDVTTAREEADALADQNLRIPTADG